MSKKGNGKAGAAKGILEALGAELRRQRRAHKFTQIELGAAAGVSEHVVGRIERGQYNPSVVVLYAITTKLGLKLSELFAGAGK